MTLKTLAAELGWTDLTPELVAEKEKEIVGGHVSDLLSDVLANAPQEGVLVTIQVHLNVVAVAVHAGLAGVIFASGRQPEESVRLKAVEEKMPLYVSPQTAFDIAGRLYALGVRGKPA